MLDVTVRPVVIVGGGRVAARKAAGLIAAGATDVTVVSPVFCEQVPAGVKRVVARYEPGHLAGAKLVFAATDVREVNDSVVRDAHARGLLVQRVDGDDRPDGPSNLPGDFSTPAVHRDGTVIVAVSTGGSPPLAAMIRDELAKQFDPVWKDMAEAMKSLRPMILESADPETRRKRFHRAATPEGVEAFRSGGIEGLKAWMLET